jgi:hypothetical protein
MSAMALGQLVLLGIPGEVFASTGLSLKSYAGIRDLVVAGYMNGYIGYIPTRDAFVRRDYESMSICSVDVNCEQELRTNAAVLVNSVLGTQGQAGFP